MNNEQSNFQKQNSLVKISAYIALLILGAVIYTLIGSAIAAFIYNIPLTDTNALFKNVNALIIIQIFAAIGTFVVPAFVYVSYFEKKSLHFLKLDKMPSLKIVIFTILIFFLANFVLDLLVKLMYLIPFESFDNSFIKGLLQAEKDSELTLKSFLKFESPFKFIVIFFMMAILPGFGEELTFRGVFMNIFKKASNNNVLFSVIFSGFIFSVVHMQLHNFLAIFFMGIMLGTIYHLTENLWVSIIAHLFNNGLIVVASYLTSINAIQYDLTETDDMPLKISIFGSVIFILAFILYRNFILKEKENPNV